MNIILSGGWSYGNIGDEVIARTSYELTHKTWPEAKIKVLSQNPSDFYKHHGIIAAQSPHIMLLSSHISDFESVINNPQKWELDSFIHIMQESYSHSDSNLYIMCGGGYLHQKWESQFVAKMYEIYMAKKCGARVAIIGQSIGPFSDAKTLEILKYCLNLCDYISVRDTDSYNFLNSLGLKITCSLGADTANVIPDFIEPDTRDKNSYVNLMLSGYSKYVSIDTKEKSGGEIPRKIIGRLSWKRYYYKYCLKRIVKMLVCKYNLHLDFIMSTTWSWDIRLVNQITKSLKPEQYTIYQDLTVEEMCHKFSSGKMLISSKMHPVIVSAAYGVPTFAISYNYKLTEYMKSIGRGNYCYLNNHLNINQILHDIEACLDIECINENYNLKDVVYHTFDDLKALFGENDE